MKGRGFSLAVRVNVWFAAVVILLSVALFLIAYFLLYRAVQDRDRAAVRAQLETYRAWYSDGGLPALSTRFFQQEGSGKETFFVRVLGPQGAALFASTPKEAGGLNPDQLRNMTATEAFAVVWRTLPASDHSKGWLIAAERLPDGSWLQVGKTTEALSALLAQFRTVFGWVVVIGLLLGIAGGAWLTRRMLAPIRQLIGTVENVITTGQMNERMPLPEKNDEISRLARLFNDMLEKNETLIRRMREALDNVAHDLRTPLTRLRGVAELALQGEPDAKICRDALLDAMEEGDRVLTMLNTLMDISEAETGLMKLDLQPVPLDEVVSEVSELFELVAQDKSITVTTAGGRGEIFAKSGGDEVVITVKDTGEGIPTEEVPRIWERLYRGDKSRSQRGLGLGLSLVRAIINAHGGGIEVQSTVGKGSNFTIHLPNR